MKATDNELRKIQDWFDSLTVGKQNEIYLKHGQDFSEWFADLPDYTRTEIAFENGYCPECDETTDAELRCECPLCGRTPIEPDPDAVYEWMRERKENG